MERVIIAGLTVYANDYGCVSRPRVLLGSRWHPSHLKWALLGRMRPKAFNVIFENERNRNTVQNAVHDVAAADAKDFPGAAIQAYQKITGITNLGPATATRLLALSRPDRIVSFNKASRKGLAKYFNLDLGGQLSAENTDPSWTAFMKNHGSTHRALRPHANTPFG